ncbi:hypothetical protein NB689_002879 [Xanthomonas sacchari]|nr:hypothetical protein [Xanthomonas sacchari]MCW0425234.1 hypothetical protein [Xanthomonas sacchari]MCW0449511.1 hypothetical protein [Xanthomonas sacchari]
MITIRLLSSTAAHTGAVSPPGVALRIATLARKPDSGGSPATEIAAIRNSTPGTVLPGSGAMISLRSLAPPRRRRIRSAIMNSAAATKLLCAR